MGSIEEELLRKVHLREFVRGVLDYNFAVSIAYFQDEFECLNMFRE